MRNKLVSKSIPFSAFFADYYLKHLKLYKKHKFLCIILSKNHVGRDRLDISEEKVWSTRALLRGGLSNSMDKHSKSILVVVQMSPLRVWPSSLSMEVVPLMMSLLQTATRSFPQWQATR